VTVSTVLLVPFGCRCGEQLEARVVLDAPAVRCSGRCSPETGCDSEDAQWHAVQPVTCEPPDGCGRVYSIAELNESDALAVVVGHAEVNEREAYR